MLLKIAVHSYKCIDSWERFNDTSLPDKKAFKSEFNLKDITAQKEFKELKLKNLDDDHDFYVQSHTLLIADVFENFRNKCIEIYKLDPAHFLSAQELAWQTCLKKLK